MSTAGSYFVAGGTFGSALLFAVWVLVLAILLPMPHPDWASFAKGAVIVPLLVVILFAFLGSVVWLLSGSGGIG